MRELTRLSGPTFDRTFVQRLHSVHSDMLPVIADAQTSTRNDLIRSLATTAAVLLNRHMAYLEHTGLVSHSTLPSHHPLPQVSHPPAMNHTSTRRSTPPEPTPTPSTPTWPTNPRP